MQTHPKKKPVAIWIVLLILPFALMALISIVQFVTQFALEGTTVETTVEMQGGEVVTEVTEESAAEKVINIASIVIGMGSVLMIIVGTPIWVTLLVIAINYNKRLAAQRAKQPHV